MCVAPRRAVRPGARNRRQQGVGEADTVVRDLDHVRVDRRAKQLRRVGVQRTGEQVDRTVAGEGRQAKRVESFRRQERKSPRDELLQRGRTWSGSPGATERSAHRAPARARARRTDSRPTRRRPGAALGGSVRVPTLAEQCLHGAHVESAELDVHQALALERRSESERALLCVRSRRDENSHGLTAKPTERNSSTARDDVSSQWTSSSATSTRCSRANSRRTLRNPAATARGCGSASGSARRSAPSSARRCGRGTGHLGDTRFEEIGERRMRELRLRRHRLRRQNEVRFGSSDDRASP